MEDFLIVLLQAVFELMVQALGESIGGFSNRPYFGLKLDLASAGGIATVLFVIGLACGVVSLFLHRSVIFHPGSVRLAALPFAPVVSGFLAGGLARWRRVAVWGVRARVYGWGAAMLALGIVLIRFTWGVR